MDTATKRIYMLETTKGAFRPFDVDATIADYNLKLRFRVLLPPPHDLPPAEWEIRIDLKGFLDALLSLRGFIKMKGLELEPWTPPPLPMSS